MPFFTTLCAVSILVGCSDSDTKNMSIHDKITKYEMNIAQKEVNQLVEDVKNIKLVPESKLISFQDFPVPNNLKNHHVELGVDISNLTFYEPLEVSTFKQLKAEHQEYLKTAPPQEDDDHGHSH